MLAHWEGEGGSRLRQSVLSKVDDLLEDHRSAAEARANSDDVTLGGLHAERENVLVYIERRCL